jgi:mono/diheme cytochrome c family protein
MRGFVAGFVVCLVLGVAGAVAYSYSGWQTIAASAPDNPTVAWFLRNTSEHSIAAGASTVVAPPNLETDANIRAGAKLYATSCAICHGAPGRDDGNIAKGLNPSPPHILSGRARNEPEVVFWVVRNGIRMTAMPAWGKSYDDTQIWSVAAFLHAKKGLSADEYKALIGG